MSTLRIAGLVVMGAVVTAVVVLFAISQVRAGEIVDGVSIEGIEVGGLGRDDAAAAVRGYADERAADQITFTHEGEEYVVDPAQVGATLDIEQVVDRALSAGRDGNLLEARWNAITGTDVDVEARPTLDEEQVADRVGEIAAEVDTEPVEGAVAADAASLTVATTSPSDGTSTQVDAAVEQVVAAFDEPGPDTLELPVEPIDTRTDQADVDEAAAIIEEAIAEDMVLTSDDGTVTLTPRDVAAMISTKITEGDDPRIRVDVKVDAIRETVVPVADDLLRSPVNASLDAPRTPPVRYDDQDDAVWRPVPADVSIIPGRNGTELDVQLASQQITAAVRNRQHEIAMELPEVPPSYSTADAESAGLDTLLSTFTTYHACCATRVTNIQRLADLVDGTVVQPGEQFSINQISGNRTCAKGFAEAGMILDGEIVDVCGGGVSQFGTTTVNAVFFAGLKPDAYKPHSFYISRYPMAREATLNYPSPDIDVRFTNDTGSPILVRTTYSGTSITVSFYGSSNVSEVRADLGGTYNNRSFSTERRTNSELPEGATKVVQTGQNGFSVGLDRTIVYDDGSTATDDWTNTYVAKKEIIEVGP